MNESRRSWMVGRSRRSVIVAAAVLLIIAVAGVWVVEREPLSPSAAPASDPATEVGGAGRPADSSGAGTSVGPDDAPDPDASPAPAGPPATGETEHVEKPAAVEEHSFDDAVPVATQLVVEIVSVEAVVAGRDIPGEISGPAVEVQIEVENIGPSAVDTSGASVNLTYGDDDLLPAPAVMDGSAALLPPSLAAGSTALASYTFSVPLDSAGNVRIMVDILAEEPDVVFTGPRP